MQCRSVCILLASTAVYRAGLLGHWEHDLFTEFEEQSSNRIGRASTLPGNITASPRELHPREPRALQRAQFESGGLGGGGPTPGFRSSRRCPHLHGSWQLAHRTKLRRRTDEALEIDEGHRGTGLLYRARCHNPRGGRTLVP
jgi:hypothetical protein